MFFPVRIFSIPDPNFFHPGSRIRIKEFTYFNPNKWFLSFRKYDSGCSYRIRILTFYPSRIPGPGVKKARSLIRIRNTGLKNLILYLSQHSASGSAGRLVIAVHFHLQSLFSGGICNVGAYANWHTSLSHVLVYNRICCKFLKNKKQNYYSKHWLEAFLICK